MIDWQAFHFLRPEWWWAVLPLALLLVVMRFAHTHANGWRQVLPAHLQSALLNEDKATKNEASLAPPLMLVGIAWLLTVLALSGPTWERLPQPVYNVKQGSVIVMDMSLSMRATDITPDRLTRARFKAIDLIESLGDGEVGMVAYAGDAFVISPLTEDAINVVSLIPSISPEIMPVPGSEPLRGFEVATELLTNAGYNQGDIYWFTDGINAEQVAVLTDYIEKSPFKVHTLAIGTQQGAPIKQVNGQLLKDATGAIVIPKMEPARLRRVSQSSGGQFAQLSATDNDIDRLQQSHLISSEHRLPSDDNMQGDVWQDMGNYIALLLLPIAAYAFRRGLIMSMVGLCLLSPLASPPASAEDNLPAQEQSSTPTRWYERAFKTPEQRGFDAYQKQQYETAANTFNDPMWQGAAHYRNGDFSAALQSYKQIDSTESLYNQGNALAKLGQLDEAIKAYERVLEREPEHQNAIANKALLEQLQQQQEQQQQNNQSEQSGQNSEQNTEQADQNSEQNDEQSDSGSKSKSESQSSDPSKSQQDNANEQQSDPQSAQQNESDSASESTSENANNDAQTQAEMRDNQQPPPTEQPEQESSASAAEKQQAMNDSSAETATQGQGNEQPMTDEEREQLQRIQSLLRKVPDDPAFLLQRKMQLENQQRLRNRAPPASRENW